MSRAAAPEAIGTAPAAGTAPLPGLAPGTTVRAEAPGKLYVMGEYAVVEPGHHAVVVAVGRRVRVDLRETAEAGLLETEHPREAAPLAWHHGPEGPVFAEESEGFFRYARAAVSVVETWRAELGLTPRHYALRIASDLADHGSGAKFGLGSSAAVTVAVVGAVCALYGLDPQPERSYRLAMLATVTVTTLTSGGDLAASALGGWVHYASPDREAVAAMLRREGVAAALTAPWPGLLLEPALPASPGAGEESTVGVRLAIGWTGTPADTPTLVGAVRRNAALPGQLLRRSDQAVADLLAALRHHDAAAAGHAVGRAREVLAELGALRGTVIETPALRLLCTVAQEQGWSAKSSGAGGGDCGIALAGTAADEHALAAAWSRHGIRPLDLGVGAPGLSVARLTPTARPAHTPGGRATAS